MKKFFIAMAVALASFSAMAQDAAEAAAQDLAAAAPAKAKPSYAQYWTESLKTNVTVGQTGLFNWAAGGDNTVSLAAYIDGNANYKKDAMFWNNRLQLDYGFLYASSKPILQKATDRIYLESKWGYQIKDQLYFSANYDFKTQFAPGYKYVTPCQKTIDEISKTTGLTIDDLTIKQQRQAWKEEHVLLSNIFSPAYTNLALGIDWKPKPYFSVSFAPLTGGYVIVANQDLRSAYSMPFTKEYKQKVKDGSMTKDEVIALGSSVYASHRFEFGAQIKVDFKAQINDVFTYTTQLVVFEDYLKDHKLNPCPRINWDNRIDWKIAKYFALTVMTNLIYDDMVMFSTDAYDKKCSKSSKYNDKYGAAGWGNKGAGPLVQFKECLSFGFTYTIASKK